MGHLQQDQYADNFQPNSFNGLAVYDPLKCAARVGDIGFFLKDGSYFCVTNAIDSKARCLISRYVLSKPRTHRIEIGLSFESK